MAKPISAADAVAEAMAQLERDVTLPPFAQPLVKPPGEPQLAQHLGLLAFCSVCRALPADVAARLEAPVTEVVRALSRIPATRLFPEWSPPACPPVLPAPLPGVHCKASSELDATHGAALALTKSGHWASSAGATKSLWQLRLAHPLPAVVGLRVTFAGDSQPLVVVVEAAASASAPFRAVAVVTSPEHEAFVPLPAGPVQKLRLRLAGHSGALGERPGATSSHTLSHVQVYVPDGTAAMVSTRQVLSDMFRWLAAVSECASGAVRQQAWRGMRQLALVTGAVDMHLQLSRRMLRLSMEPGGARGAGQAADDEADDALEGPEFAPFLRGVAWHAVESASMSATSAPSALGALLRAYRGRAPP